MSTCSRLLRCLGIAEEVAVSLVAGLGQRDGSDHERAGLHVEDGVDTLGGGVDSWGVVGKVRPSRVADQGSHGVTLLE